MVEASLSSTMTEAWEGESSIAVKLFKESQITTWKGFCTFECVLFEWNWVAFIAPTAGPFVPTPVP